MYSRLSMAELIPKMIPAYNATIPKLIKINKKNLKLGNEGEEERIE